MSPAEELLHAEPGRTVVRTLNGTRVESQGPFLLHGFRVTSKRSSEGPSGDHEYVIATTLDGRRQVAYWISWPHRPPGGSIAHYRDRGEDVVNGVTLDELLRLARERWPPR